MNKSTIFRILQVTVLIAGLAFLPSRPALANGSVTVNTDRDVAAFFMNCKKNEASLIAFLHKMPKGADVHLHPSGAVYAEHMVDKAVADGLFYDRASRSFTVHKPSGGFISPEEMQFNYKKYNEILSALGFHNTAKNSEGGNVLFFASFGRFGQALPGGKEQIREVVLRAAAQRISHLEMMTGPRVNADGSVNVEATRQKLEQYNAARAEAMKELAAAGQPFEVSVLWSLSLYRDAAPMKDGKPDMTEYDSWWRGQTAGILEAAHLCADLGAVAVTVLAPEDSWVARTRFAAQFRIIDEEWRAFHKKYPGNKVRMNPHGGELTMEFSPYEDLRARISETLSKGHAARLGHGVSIAWDDNVYTVLKKMRDERIALELCLTSNQGILNVAPSKHPFRLYWEAGVPIIVNTDDEGISRGNLTIEYVRAAQWFNLSYGQIKWLVFNSIEYSFLPGESLFIDGDFNKVKIDGEAPKNSPKAEHQRRLLADFTAFEEGMKENMKLFQ